MLDGLEQARLAVDALMLVHVPIRLRFAKCMISRIEPIDIDVVYLIVS